MNNKTLVKDLEYYMALPYTIVLTPPDPKNPEDTWFAEIAELNGCMTWGESREEVLELIEDAKKSWLTEVLKDGYMAIPEPQND